MTQRYNAHILVVLSTILMAGGTAEAQYLWLDTNGDGLNWMREAQNGDYSRPADCLFLAVENVDVYVATDRDADGTPVTCASEGALTINSYQIVLRFYGDNVIFNGWTDAMGFNTPFITSGDGTFATSGSSVWVGRAGDAKPPGTYKLGTLSVTVTGTPVLFFVTSDVISGDAMTAFGSDCKGSDVPGMVVYGLDFPVSNAFGTCPRDPVLPTTWGKIKQQYR